MKALSVSTFTENIFVWYIHSYCYLNNNHKIKRFISVYKTAHQLFQSQFILLQYTSSNIVTSLSILILPYHILLHLPRGLVPSSFSSAFSLKRAI
jgi:hypothetical protein